MTVTRETPIAFVGLGNLGQAMALNLAERGWPLRVFDRNEERAAPLRSAGATQASGPADLVDAEIVCFAVPDERAINSILGDGLLERLTERNTIVVHSTIPPARARELAASIRASSGARYLDVPVSGGAERARSGELTLFIGGSDSDVDAIKPFLDDLGTDAFRLGPVGAASAAKLANQLVMFAALAGVHEALRLTQAAGVADKAVLDAIGTGTGDTWVGRNWGFFDRVAHDYNESGVSVADRPWSKDLGEVVSAGRDAGLSLPLAGLLAQSLAVEIENHASATNDTLGAGQ